MKYYKMNTQTKTKKQVKITAYPTNDFSTSWKDINNSEIANDLDIVSITRLGDQAAELRKQIRYLIQEYRIFEIYAEQTKIEGALAANVKMRVMAGISDLYAEYKTVMRSYSVQYKNAMRQMSEKNTY